jgi:hypothetical protein
LTPRRAPPGTLPPRAPAERLDITIVERLLRQLAACCALRAVSTAFHSKSLLMAPQTSGLA